MMTREEHLEWCKKRALEYADRGDLTNAVASMGSDLTEHAETKCPDELIAIGIMFATNGDTSGVRRWIEGFG